MDNPLPLHIGHRRVNTPFGSLGHMKMLFRFLWDTPFSSAFPFCNGSSTKSEFRASIKKFFARHKFICNDIEVEILKKESPTLKSTCRDISTL